MKSPSVIEPTIRRPSTVSVRMMLSASETPVFWTSIVKVWLAPPAVTVAESNVLVTDEDDVLDDVDRVGAAVGAVLVGRRRRRCWRPPGRASVVGGDVVGRR